MTGRADRGTDLHVCAHVERIKLTRPNCLFRNTVCTAAPAAQLIHFPGPLAATIVGLFAGLFRFVTIRLRSQRSCGEQCLSCSCVGVVLLFFHIWTKALSVRTIQRARRSKLKVSDHSAHLAEALGVNQHSARYVQNLRTDNTQCGIWYAVSCPQACLDAAWVRLLQMRLCVRFRLRNTRGSSNRRCYLDDDRDRQPGIARVVF